VLLPRPSARRCQATAPLPGLLHLRRAAMVLIRPPARCRGPSARLPRPPARRLPLRCAAMATSTGRHHPLPLRRTAACLDGALRHRRVDSRSTSRCPSGFFSPASPARPVPPSPLQFHSSRPGPPLLAAVDFHVRRSRMDTASVDAIESKQLVSMP
jgi:hypothetical protein